MKNNSRPPKGMYINHDDLVTMATGPNTQGEHLLKSMDREIISYKRVVSHCIYKNHSFSNIKGSFSLKLKNLFLLSLSIVEPTYLTLCSRSKIINKSYPPGIERQ